MQWDGATRSITISRAEADGVVNEERDEQEPVESLSVWVEADREAVPEGGNQQVTIIVTVADNQRLSGRRGPCLLFCRSF